jgi:hypothetical protein
VELKRPSSWATVSSAAQILQEIVTHAKRIRMKVERFRILPPVL